MKCCSFINERRKKKSNYYQFQTQKLRSNLTEYTSNVEEYAHVGRSKKGRKPDPVGEGK